MPNKRRRKRRRSIFGAVTKKDFQAVAGILCRHGASTTLSRDFADYFGAQNPRFNRDRFLVATQRC